MNNIRVWLIAITAIQLIVFINNSRDDSTIRRNGKIINHGRCKHPGKSISLLHMLETLSLYKDKLDIPNTTKGHSVISMPESTFGGFFTVDRKWKVEYWNKEAERLLGISEKDILGKNLWDKFATAIPMEFYANYQLAFQQNAPIHFIEYWPEMGRWFEVTAFPSPDMLSVYFKDIPAKKHSPDQLLISKIRYEVANEASNAAVWDWNFYTGEFYLEGKGHKKTFGYNVEEALVPFAFREECMHPDDKKRVLDGLTHFLSEKSERIWEDEYRFKKANGDFAYVHDRGYLVHNSEDIPYRMIGSMQDITERKVIEIKLQQSERRFRALVQNGADLISIFDAEGKFTYVSPTVLCALGFEADIFVGKNAFALIHPEDVKYAYRQFKSLKKGETLETKPFRFLNKKNEWRWMETTLTNLLNDPAVQGIVANSRDITEKKKTQDELNRLSFIIRETQHAVIIADEHGRITWVNKAFTQLTESTESEWTGKDQFAIFNKKYNDAKALDCARKKINNKESFDCEVVFYNKKGRKYWLQFTGHCMPDLYSKGHQCFAMLTDLTDKVLLKNKMEEERILQEKIIKDALITTQEKEQSVIGEELQDNISQILGATKLYVELAKTDTKNRSMLLTKSSVHIINAMEEIKRLSKTMALHSIQVLGLSDSIKNVLEDIAVENSIEIKFESYGIAEDEMDEKMKLQIFRIVQKQLENIIQHSKATKGTINLARKENEIELLITDNGQGFDASTKGPGVGIRNVIGRASLYDGKVTINSIPGKGFQLKVVLSLNNQTDLQHNLSSS